MQSFSLVKPYFRDRMNFLKYREWTDFINIENIPETILDKSYHIRVGSISRDSQANGLTARQTATVKVFFKGFRSPASADDKAYLELETILAEILAIKYRTTGVGGLRNVVFNSASTEALTISNDSVVILTIEFNCRIEIALCD
jgi:hypothetical protein